jgi:DNA (cytosine-5)-methyltransferase 1
MADADNAQRRADNTDRNDGDWQTPEWNECNGNSAKRNVFGGPVYPDGGNAAPENLQRSGEYRQRPEDSSALRSTIEGIGHNSGGDLDRAGPTDGHWPDADWLFCRDGKWRPVEPGTFPLVNGTPARMGRLRGYGNGIVATQAAEFIKAYDGVRS